MAKSKNVTAEQSNIYDQYTTEKTIVEKRTIIGPMETQSPPFDEAAGRTEKMSNVMISEKVIQKLLTIAMIGGNIAEENYLNASGPRDAAHRGLLMTIARRLAIEALQELGQDIPMELSGIVKGYTKEEGRKR